MPRTCTTCTHPDAGPTAATLPRQLRTSGKVPSASARRAVMVLTMKVKVSEVIRPQFKRSQTILRPLLYEKGVNMEKHPECTATRRDGHHCQGTPMPGKMFCFAHDPDLREQRQQWTTDAGRSKSNSRRLKKSLGLDTPTLTLTEIDALLCLTLKAVVSERIEPGIATSAAGVAKAIMAIRTASDLESRLAALEQRAGLQVAS